MNNHIFAAKLRRLATELESVQVATQQLVTKNRYNTRTATLWGGISVRAFDGALKLVIANFRILADHLKPVKVRR